MNDYRDLEKDSKHPIKKNRPLASGRIKPSVGVIIMILCLLCTAFFSSFLRDINSYICLFLYFVLNLVYSMGFKNMPIVDVVILAAGFVIRTFYGGFVTGIVISNWLYLVLVTGSLYMGLGKRRNELKKQTDTREVLKYYNISFLDKNMYVCVALTNVFYAMWTLEMASERLIWTVPFFTIILMCYSLDVEGDSDGDPVEVILQDKKLIGLVIVYAMCIFLFIYVLR